MFQAFWSAFYETIKQNTQEKGGEGGWGKLGLKNIKERKPLITQIVVQWMEEDRVKVIQTQLL